MNGTIVAATKISATAILGSPIDSAEGDKPFRIEIQVCESIFEHIKDRKPTPLYHVEVRFVPRPGGPSIYFQGQRYRERAPAEADKTFVESVLRRSALKKPKPPKKTRTKKRSRTKRRSRRS